MEPMHFSPRENCLFSHLFLFKGKERANELKVFKASHGPLSPEADVMVSLILSRGLKAGLSKALLSPGVYDEIKRMYDIHASFVQSLGRLRRSEKTQRQRRQLVA